MVLREGVTATTRRAYERYVPSGIEGTHGKSEFTFMCHVMLCGFFRLHRKEDGQILDASSDGLARLRGCRAPARINKVDVSVLSPYTRGKKEAVRTSETEGRTANNVKVADACLPAQMAIPETVTLVCVDSPSRDAGHKPPYPEHHGALQALAAAFSQQILHVPALHLVTDQQKL